MRSANELRADIAKMSPAQVALLRARVAREKETRRTTWLCPIPRCDGSPHRACPTRHARADQRLPFKVGDGKTGVIAMAGRGWGKTRFGAEGVRSIINTHGRIGLIGRTAADVRDVMIEGESGLLNIFPKWERPEYYPSKRKIVFSNGAAAFAYSSQDPDLLRGPQHDWIWGDEFSTWMNLKGVIYNALMGLRLGSDPRMVITGTPRPTRAVKDLVKNDQFILVRGTTYDNLGNLSNVFRQTVISQYEGTRVGRQELNGELLLDVKGALLSYEIFEREGFRCDPTSIMNDVTRITVNVDPAVTSTTKSDYTGISVTAVNETNQTGYVLWTERFKGTPAEAMSRAARMYDEHMANFVVAEVNNGGDYVKTVMNQIRPDIPVRNVHASVGKIARAEPVAMLYEQGRIHHVGNPAIFAQLEDEWTSWVPKGVKDDEGNDIGSDESPDTMDSVVWGFTLLMLPNRRTVKPARAVNK